MNSNNLRFIFLFVILSIGTLNCQFFVDIEHVWPRIGKRLIDSSAGNYPTSNEKESFESQDNGLNLFVKRNIAKMKKPTRFLNEEGLIKIVYNKDGPFRKFYRISTR
jgi:hypothetical protein